MGFRVLTAFWWTLCLLQTLAPSAHGVNIEAAFEQQCVPGEGFVTQDFENNWIATNNVSRLYLPMLSKLDALRISQSILKTTDIGFLRKRDVDMSCLEIKPGATEFLFSGYCGHTNTKSLTMTKPKVFSAPPTFPGDVGTNLLVSLTNNRDWQVMEVCWEDGQRSFAVLSSKPTLSPCDKKLITSHLKAIGYKPEFFYGLRYEHCPFICGTQGQGMAGLGQAQAAAGLQLRARF